MKRKRKKLLKASNNFTPSFPPSSGFLEICLTEARSNKRKVSCNLSFVDVSGDAEKSGEVRPGIRRRVHVGLGRRRVRKRGKVLHLIVVITQNTNLHRNRYRPISACNKRFVYVLYIAYTRYSM